MGKLRTTLINHSKRIHYIALDEELMQSPQIDKELWETLRLAEWRIKELILQVCEASAADMNIARQLVEEL